MSLEEQYAAASRRNSQIPDSFSLAPRIVSGSVYLRYDRERGEVQTLTDGVVREAIQVRRGLEDQMVLEAVVEELRRRGYTVIRPEDAP